MKTKPLALIIEDNYDQNEVFTKALEKAGYETESIADGGVAQMRLGEVVPDMIILDLHIPNVNGSQLLRQIRSDRRLDGARVIIATADAAQASALHSQVDLVLLKPISYTQLAQLTERYLHHPKPLPHS
jgi:CheY-like chemotaxis protein